MQSHRDSFCQSRDQVELPKSAMVQKSSWSPCSTMENCQNVEGGDESWSICSLSSVSSVRWWYLRVLSQRYARVQYCILSTTLVLGSMYSNCHDVCVRRIAGMRMWVALTWNGIYQPIVHIRVSTDQEHDIYQSYYNEYRYLQLVLVIAALHTPHM